MRLADLLSLAICLSTATLAQQHAPELTPGREPIPNAQVFLSTVNTPAGFPVRIFITRPKNAVGKVPVIFMVGWLSCDSVEAPQGAMGDGFIQLLFDLASRSGFATYRMEKPGVGESGGPKCGDADFNTELAAYRTAFASMKDIDFIDASRVYMLGLSNGGGFAPLVAGDSRVRGYMIFSGWYKTWLEHMLEHERRRMALSGISQPEISSRMKKYAKFYDLYLNDRQTPRTIVAQHPEMKDIWYDEPERQYGRPAAFYQQLQQLNLAQAWQSVSAPVLAVHGEYDWIMSGDDYKLLVAALNARNPGSAQFTEWPRADHDLLTHASAEKAFGSDPEKHYDPKLSEFVLGWLSQHERP